MVDCVRLTKGGVSANTAVSVNSRGRGLYNVTACSEKLLMIYED